MLSGLLSVIPKQGWALFGVLLVLGAFTLGSYGYGYGSGTANATAEAAEAMDEYKEKVREREREQARLLVEANESTAELERTHEQRISELRANLNRENAEAAARDANTIADLRNGTRRLRLSTTNCGSTASGRADSPSTGIDGARSAELTPEASAALWRIAGDGDRAIRKLTALQQWAKAAVDLCGTKPEEGL